MYRLHQKLLELEQEREMMNQKFQDFMDREEQMRQIIEENQLQIHQLRYYSRYQQPSRHNSYKTASTVTRTSSYDDEYYYYYPRSKYYYYYPKRHSYYNSNSFY